jgi:hypothetical protein
MANQANWTWLERVIRRIPLPKPVIYNFTFITIYLIYYFFSTKVFWFEWNIYHNFQSLAASILIAYLLGGTQFLLDKMRDTLKYIDILNNSDSNDFYAKLEERFTKSYVNRILLEIFVIGPFIILSWGILPYQELEPNNKWAMGLDIYGYLLLFFILFLFSEILWILINSIWSLNDISISPNGLILETDVFSTVLKLKPLRNFLLIFIFIYFLAIALAIITYLGPSNVFPYEIVFFAALLLAGVALFFIGLEAIQGIIDRQVENELDILNKKRVELRELFMSAISRGKPLDKNDEMNNISVALAFVQKEKTDLMEFNKRAYDITSISIFIVSFLIPLVTLVKELVQIKI